MTDTITNEIEDLQQRVTETGHAMQEIANDLNHAAKHTHPGELSKALGLVLVNIEQLRSLISMQRHEAEKLDNLPW